jgi:hypothetical protein
LVGSISGSVAFTARQYDINPGLPTSFPWLSTIAANWQQYRFHKLHYRFVTRTSTATVGSVILSPDYNPNEPAPTTEAQASNTQDAVEDTTWKDLVCKMDPSSMFPFGPRKQVRRTALNADLSVYDAGTMFVCTLEEVGTDAIGKLWVDYDVELFVPQNSPSGYTMPIGTSLFTNSSDETFTSTVAKDLTFGTVQYDPLGIGVDTAGVFTPPAGIWKVRVSFNFNDNTWAETRLCSLAIQRAGAALVGGTRHVGFAATSGACDESIAHEVVAAFTGTQTCSANVTLTGATGPLVVRGTTGALRATISFVPA